MMNTLDAALQEFANKWVTHERAISYVLIQTDRTNMHYHNNRTESDGLLINIAKEFTSIFVHVILRF